MRAREDRQIEITVATVGAVMAVVAACVHAEVVVAVSLVLSGTSLGMSLRP